MFNLTDWARNNCSYWKTIIGLQTAKYFKLHIMQGNKCIQPHNKDRNKTNHWKTVIGLQAAKYLKEDLKGAASCVVHKE